MHMSIIETLKNTFLYNWNDFYGLTDSSVGLKLAWIVFKNWFISVLTFQWLHDFIKLPITTSEEFQSVFADLPSMTNLQSVNLNFFERSSPPSEIAFLSGFLNCLFFYLPVSPVQFIWLRQVVLDRNSAAATFGIILGNLSFFGVCLFGFREIINSWFGLEPFSYFFGVALTFFVIFDMAQKPTMAIQRTRKKNIQMFLITFVLVWTDPPGFYQFFGNLSLHSGITPLDFVQSPYFYFFGLFIGSVFWTFVIRISFSRFRNLFSRLTKFPSSYWIRGFNYFCLIGSISATLSSFHYYGIDYLFANPLGFVPQDSAWEALNLPAFNLTTETKDTSKGRLGEKSNYQSLDTDLSTFDRGRYKGGPVVESHFESLNYQEEYAWRARIDRASSRRRSERFFDPADLLSEEALFLRHNKRQQKRRVEQQKRLQKQKQKQKQKTPTSTSTPIRMPPVEDYVELDLKRELERELEEEERELERLEREERELEQENVELEFDESEFDESEEEEFDQENVELESEEEESDEEFDQIDPYMDWGENKFDEDDEFLGLEEEMEDPEEAGDLVKRFIKNYSAEANLDDDAIPDLEEEKMIYFSAFSELDKLGFDLFSMFEPIELDPLDDELAKEMKDKFSENFVNRFWLNFDISNFSKRSPHKLSSTDEISLFEKRLALGEYYDTLRSYANLPISQNYKYVFCGPKSYVNRVYNQQFKGTLKFVERLFEIHLEDEENIPAIVPPEDLYEDFEIVVANSRNTPEENLYLKLKKDASVLKFDQPLYKTNFLKKNPLIHEEFLDQMELSQEEADSTPFLEESKPLPFFIGWDRSERKFVVTNRLLTREKTLLNSKLPNSSFTFTTWPVTKEALEDPDLLKNQRWSRLYRTADEVSEAIDDVFSYFEPESDSDIEEKMIEIFFETDDEDEDEEERRERRERREEERRREAEERRREEEKRREAKERREAKLREEERQRKEEKQRRREEQGKRETKEKRERREKREAEKEQKKREKRERQEAEMPPVVYDTLPSIVKRIEVKSPERLDVPLAPKRGGLIWPGHR